MEIITKFSFRAKFTGSKMFTSLTADQRYSFAAIPQWIAGIESCFFCVNFGTKYVYVTGFFRVKSDSGKLNIHKPEMHILDGAPCWVLARFIRFLAILRRETKGISSRIEFIILTYQPLPGLFWISTSANEVIGTGTQVWTSNFWV